MRGRRHDATGRSSATPLAKFKPKNRPKECGFTQFCWMPLEMMESEAFRALSANSRRLLDRILIEHVHQGVMENSRLVVRGEVARDLSDSAFDFKRVVWPAIEPWCRGGVIEPVEAVSPGAFASRAERCHYLAAAWDQLSQDDRQRFLRRAI